MNAAMALNSATTKATTYTVAPPTNRSRAGQWASGGSGTVRWSPCSVHSKIKPKPADMPRNTALYMAIATFTSAPSPGTGRYCATVAVENGISTTNSSRTRLRKSSVLSTSAMLLISMWWLTQMMPMTKKLSRYAPNDQRCSQSWCCSPLPDTAMLSASRVIATAKTPSLNASSRPRSTALARSAGCGRLLDLGQDLVHAVLDLALPARHVLAGEVVQDGQHPVLAVQDVELLLGHLVQRDQRLVIRDGAAVAGGLGPVGADLQRDHDRQLRQVEDDEQQRPGRLVEPDDVAEEQPDHDADGDEDEHVHRAAEPVDPIGDLVQDAGPAHVFGQDQLGDVQLRARPNLHGPLVQVLGGLVDSPQGSGVGVRAREMRSRGDRGFRG